MEVCPDDALDASKLDHHFLVVRVALGRSARLYGLAHDHVDLQALSLLVGEFKEVAVFEEEVDILSLLDFVPIVMVFGAVGLRVYSSLDSPYLSIIIQILCLFRNRHHGINRGF